MTFEEHPDAGLDGAHREVRRRLAADEVSELPCCDNPTPYCHSTPVRGKR